MKNLNEPIYGLYLLPETEAEFWIFVEEYETGLRRMQSERQKKHLNLNDSEIEEAASKITQALDFLYELLEEKFHVLSPAKTPKPKEGQKRKKAPKGMIYHDDWLKKMIATTLKEEYRNYICSACPYSRGKEHFLARARNGICHLINEAGLFKEPEFCDKVYDDLRLQGPQECAVVRQDLLDWETLLKRASEEFGPRRKETLARKRSELEKEKHLCAKYNQMLCAACAFGIGYEPLKTNEVPCSLCTSTVARSADFKPCAYSSEKKITLEAVAAKIANEYGENALNRFNRKRRQLTLN